MNMFLSLNPAFVLLLALVFALMWFVHPKKPQGAFINAFCWALYSIYLLAFPVVSSFNRWDVSIFHTILLLTTFLSAFQTVQSFTPSLNKRSQ